MGQCRVLGILLGCFLNSAWRLTINGQIGVFHDATGESNGTKEGEETKLAPI